ncbi:MAG: SdpI family protein [Hymenobacteraceae bacterium]|nr:SdpI family protein [Hymenobacteraceae bacterium]MDX5396136.1 SdpI family protein [Hymenobacteraceae bacterium]MDX5512197.1 SdpI family protein [Hymenobacteraceae bacterium]
MKILNWLKQEWIYLLLLVLPFILIGYYWEQIPDRFPVHYNLEGKPDGWADSPLDLWLVLLLNVPSYFLFYFLPVLDKNKKNTSFYRQHLPLIRFLVHLLLCFIPVIMLFGAINNQIDVWVLKVGLIVFIMLLSNFISSAPQNYFIGFRTPWALLNERVWRKTQVFSARLWFGLSALMLIAIIGEVDNEILFLLYVCLLVLLPFLYSFLVYKRVQSEV